MCFENFDWTLVLFLVYVSGWPDVCFPVLAATNDVSSIIAESSMNLTAGVLVSSKLDFEVSVLEVVQSYPRIIAGNEEFGFSTWIIRRVSYGVYTRNLASLGIATPGRPDVDLRVDFQALGFVEEAKSVQTSCNRSLPVWCERHRSHHVRDISPKRNSLVRDAPQSEFRIQGPSQEETVVSRMKLNGGDKVAVFEATEAFSATDMPQSDCLVHR